MTPIVLHHGIFGMGVVRIGRLRISYFNRIDRAIEARGHELIVTRVHPTSAIARRASGLKRTILARLEGNSRQRVVIFAHSMGGLDARYMITRLGMAEK
ncbi:MAG: esterase/lipase family protein, partial [Tepidisphaeraceae bacterium]